MQYLRVTDWDRHKPRKDRANQKWLKIYLSLTDNPDWIRLTDAQRGQLLSIWLLASKHDGSIPGCGRDVRKLCGLDDEPDLDLFVSLGFLSVDETVAKIESSVDETVAKIESSVDETVAKIESSVDETVAKIESSVDEQEREREREKEERSPPIPPSKEEKEREKEREKSPPHTNSLPPVVTSVLESGKKMRVCVREKNPISHPEPLPDDLASHDQESVGLDDDPTIIVMDACRHHLPRLHVSEPLARRWADQILAGSVGDSEFELHTLVDEFFRTVAARSPTKPQAYIASVIHDPIGFVRENRPDRGKRQDRNMPPPRAPAREMTDEERAEEERKREIVARMRRRTEERDAEAAKKPPMTPEQHEYWRGRFREWVAQKRTEMEERERNGRGPLDSIFKLTDN